MLLVAADFRQRLAVTGKRIEVRRREQIGLRVVLHGSVRLIVIPAQRGANSIGRSLVRIRADGSSKYAIPAA